MVVNRYQAGALKLQGALICFPCEENL